MSKNHEEIFYRNNESNEIIVGNFRVCKAGEYPKKQRETLLDKIAILFNASGTAELAGEAFLANLKEDK